MDALITSLREIARRHGSAIGSLRRCGPSESSLAEAIVTVLARRAGELAAAGHPEAEAILADAVELSAAARTGVDAEDEFLLTRAVAVAAASGGGGV